MLGAQAQPILGRIIEASPSGFVILTEQEIRAGHVCRLFVDLPTPSNGQRNYLDCKFKVTTATLQADRFKLIGQIVDMPTAQQDQLNHALG